MCLHIVSKSPTTASELIYSVVDMVSKSKNCSILFIDDGVYFLNWAKFSEKILSVLSENETKIYAIAGDIQARGIKNIDVVIKQIDYNEFVKLTEKNEKSITW